MGIYSLFGVGGSIVKWQVTIGTRYLGVLYRIWGVLVGLSSVTLNLDYIFPIIFLIYSYYLETEYTELGYEAVKYVDSEWEQGPNTIYPFDV